MLTVPEPLEAQTLRVPVLKVFDGDGFLTRIHHPGRGVSVDIAIRLGFIDAPEMDRPGGPEAQAFLQSIIGGRSVDLVILTKMDTGGIVDRHGRIVAVPYLPVACQDNPAPQRPWDMPMPRNVELEMVLNGWAWVLEQYGPDERYFEALEDAQRCRRGIWAFDRNVHPWEHKKERYRIPKPQRQDTDDQPSLFAGLEGRRDCPTGCRGKLLKKSGRFGQFLGCSNFPRCRYSCND